MNGEDIHKMNFDERLEYLRHLRDNKENIFIIDMSKFPNDIINVCNLDNDMLDSLKSKLIN